MNFNLSDWRKLMDGVIKHLNWMVLRLVEEIFVVRAYSVGLSNWCEEGGIGGCISELKWLVFVMK